MNNRRINKDIEIPVSLNWTKEMQLYFRRYLHRGNVLHHIIRYLELNNSVPLEVLNRFKRDAKAIDDETPLRYDSPHATNPDNQQTTLKDPNENTQKVLHRGNSNSLPVPCRNSYGNVSTLGVGNPKN